MRKTPYDPDVSNEEVMRQAEQANRAAAEYHRQRETGTARNFDELEFDYPNVHTERIDPENSSWTDNPTDQSEVLLADDSILPKLSDKDTTPLSKAQKKSDRWIKEHGQEKQRDSSSPYHQRKDGSADLVG